MGGAEWYGLTEPYLSIALINGHASRGRRLALLPLHSALSPPLTYIPIWVYNPDMPRAATTTDAFNAVAEPGRRRILDALAHGERPVTSLVSALDMSQPQVSKHLRVLREVGLVEVREEGRRRIYRLNGERLKPIHDWVREFEQSWNERFEALDEVLEDLKAKEETDGDKDEQ
jgi:DNA-binding transcriptional ArsR family regulator